MTRTWVFVMIADDEMDQWDDSEALGRQRQWFSSDVARRLLSVHKPVSMSPWRPPLSAGGGGDRAANHVRGRDEVKHTSLCCFWLSCHSKNKWELLGCSEVHYNQLVRASPYITDK